MSALIVTLNGAIHRETPRIAQHADVVDLNTAPGVAGSYTVPATCNHLRFLYTAGVLYTNVSGTTAAAPGAAVTNGTASSPVMNGESMSVSPGQVISLFNASAAWITIQCRRSEG